MANKIALPNKTDQLERWFENEVKSGKTLRNPQAVKWWLTHWYLMGARSFTNINYNEGSIQIGYLDERGILQFQYEEIVAQYQAKMGRLMSIQLAPAVKRKGISLEGQRKSSIAQACLSAAFPKGKVNELQQQIFPPLLRYGTVGLAVWAEGEDSIGIEVVMPWELLPIPAKVSNPTEVRGIIRRRFVPVSWVKDLEITPGKKSQKYAEIEKFRLPTGSLPNEINSQFQGSGISYSTEGAAFFSRPISGNYPQGGKSLSKSDQTQEDVTEFAELWTDTTDGFLAEYLVFVGGKLFYRADHSPHKFPKPIEIIRDIPTGGFFGRSSMELMIPLNSELEYVIGSAFQTAIDYDLYGLLMTPTTLGVDEKAIRGEDGIRRVKFEPDYTAPADIKPFNIAPAKPAKFQVEAVQLGLGLMDKISNLPKELMQGGAPGRVDSAQALGFLYETASVPMTPTAKSIATGVSNIYRSMLAYLRETWGDEKVVDITHLDDALAGIKMDPETGQMQLAENAIPHPDEVEVTVDSEIPRSKEQMKAELKEELKQGIITPREYRIEARKRDLDLPVANEAEWQNYRRAMLENIILFGDGQSPGQVEISDNDQHLVHMDVLDAFMARPEFYLASDEVKAKFQEHKQAHQMGLGMLPEGMPSVDEAAQMAVQPGMGMGNPVEAGIPMM